MSDASYFVETRWGGSEDSPSPSRLAEVIAELDVSDEEHPDTWLVHVASGWTLRLDEERFAYLDNEDLEPVAHMKAVLPVQALDLWLRFATSGPAAIEHEPWTKGPRIFSNVEIEAIHECSRQLTLEGDRRFFALLGPENQDRKCRKAGCTRGHVQYSALCARHHFEQIRSKPLPPELEA